MCCQSIPPRGKDPNPQWKFVPISSQGWMWSIRGNHKRNIFLHSHHFIRAISHVISVSVEPRKLLPSWQDRVDSQKLLFNMGRKRDLLYIGPGVPGACFDQKGLKSFNHRENWLSSLMHNDNSIITISLLLLCIFLGAIFSNLHYSFHNWYLSVTSVTALAYIFKPANNSTREPKRDCFV